MSEFSGGQTQKNVSKAYSHFPLCSFAQMKQRQTYSLRKLFSI